MTQRLYVIGVDGGGTKTVARLTDTNTQPVVEIISKSSNLQQLGVQKSADFFYRIIRSLCNEGKITPNRVSVVAIGAAGAGRKNDQDKLERELLKKWKRVKYKPKAFHIVCDADIALESAFGVDPGIIVICGSGSIVYGRDLDGTIYRCGGWGSKISDAGGGFSIGRRAVSTVFQVFDGCVEATELFSLFKNFANISSQEELINLVYNSDASLANFAPVVFEAAEKKDPISLGILDEETNSLAEILRCAVKKFSFKDYVPISLIGSLFLNSLYRQIVSDKIKKYILNARIQLCPNDPIDGAIAMAIRLGGGRR